MYVIAMPIFAFLNLHFENAKCKIGFIKQLYLVLKTTVIPIVGIIPTQIKGRYIPNNL